MVYSFELQPGELSCIGFSHGDPSAQVTFVVFVIVLHTSLGGADKGPTLDGALIHHLLGEALLVHIAPVAGLLHRALVHQAVDVGLPRLPIPEDACNRLHTA